MKKLIISFLFLISTSAYAGPCANKIDNSKVMLFIDTNDSELEIATAEKAACQRGQKMVIIPKNYKEYSVYIEKAKAAKKAAESCKNNLSSAICITRQENEKDAIDELRVFQKTQPKYEAEIRAELDKIHQEKGSLENIIISGHDGGGNFGGMKKYFNKNEFAKILKDYTLDSDGNGKDVNHAKSLMLLGCYSGVQQEVIDWQLIMPQVRLIAGYDASAPFPDRPAGHEYLYDILTKEKSLITTADQKKLEALVKNNIGGLRALNASVYLRPECKTVNDEKSYYYGQTSDKKREFRPLEISECEKNKKLLLAKNEELTKYEYGELEIPKDTSRGPMREIYSLAQSNKHCEKTNGFTIDVDKAFGLLFYEGVTKNFADYYDKDMQKVEKIIQEMDVSDMIKEADQGLIALQAEKEKLKLFEKDPAKYIEQEKKDYEALKKKFDEMRTDPKYKSLDNLSSLTQDQIAAAQELYQVEASLMYKKDDLENAKKSSSDYLETKKRQLDYKEENLRSQKETTARLKSDIKNIWIPTKKNLEGKSRKETLENLHKMHVVLSAPLPEKVRKALSWTRDTSTARLQHFNNPFSWHEFTGSAETPPSQAAFPGE